MFPASDRHPARLRRSVLCVPADNPRALAKIATLDCDAVIYDLEDAVHPDRKTDARNALMRHLDGIGAVEAQMERVVRINSVASGFGEEDLAAVMACGANAVLLPKVESPQTVLDVAERLADSDDTQELRLWAMIETPRGVLNVAPIAETGRTRGGRLDCLVPGLNDLRRETGVVAREGRTYLVPWLMQILLAARGSGLDVLDAVFNEIRDVEGFAAECAIGRDMGFDGKMLIHPDQIAPANAAFGVSDAAEAAARRIIDGFAQPANAGQAVIALDGQMVERLHLDQALALIARAEAIRHREPSR